MNKRALPPLPTLRAFDAAAKHLSFKLAANELCVTPSAISHHIQHLEDYLLTKLFHRHNRHLTLTDAGTLYWRKIKDALDDIENASHDISELDQGELLTFSIPPMLLQSSLIPKLNELLLQNSSINFRFIDTLERMDFQKHNIDAAIWYGYGDWKNVYRELLFKEDVCVVCSPTLLSGELPLNSASDLKHHTLIHTEKRLSHWKTLLEINDSDSISSKRSLRFLHSNSALYAALQGLGVAIINRIFLGRYVEEGKLVIPFEIKQDVSQMPGYYFVCPEANLSTNKVSQLKEWVIKVMTEHT